MSDADTRAKVLSEVALLTPKVADRVSMRMTTSALTRSTEPVTIAYADLGVEHLMECAISITNFGDYHQIGAHVSSYTRTSRTLLFVVRDPTTRLRGAFEMITTGDNAVMGHRNVVSPGMSYAGPTVLAPLDVHHDSMFAYVRTLPK